MKLVATKTFTYAGNRISIGETFETKTDRDAKLLLGIYSARPIEERKESKIPNPPKEIIERTSNKPVETPKIEDKPSVEAPKEPEAEKPAEEPKVEDKPKETPKVEDKPEEDDKAAATNKRTYNRKK